MVVFFQTITWEFPTCLTELSLYAATEITFPWLENQADFPVHTCLQNGGRKEKQGQVEEIRKNVQYRRWQSIQLEFWNYSGLLDALLDYKSYMECHNSDLNADKNKKYEAVRVKLASKYMHDTSMFGPEKIEPISEGDNRDKDLKKCEDDKAKIRKGYSRVLDKIKSLRQKFSNAVKNRHTFRV